MFTIYLSYRPQDSPMLVKDITDRLMKEFGESSIVKDVHQKRDIANPQAHNPQGAMQWAINQCDVMVIIMGRYWLVDKQGNPLLENPQDLVSQELNFAFLRQGLPIIPVLIDGAKMPTEPRLMNALRLLTSKNPAVIRANDFDRDMAHLIDQLKKLASGQISGVRTFAEPDNEPDEFSANALKRKNGIALLGLAFGTAIGLLIVAILLLQSVP